MASRDWFKERVDLGLLADDIDTSDNADSPFESTSMLTLNRNAGDDDEEEEKKNNDSKKKGGAAEGK